MMIIITYVYNILHGYEMDKYNEIYNINKNNLQLHERYN